jgi:hypothetical protein
MAFLKEDKMKSVLFLLLLVFTWGSAVSGLMAETIITNDGKRIKGEIVGFENGAYQVQIGKFIKQVPEFRVRQILNDDDIQQQGNNFSMISVNDASGSAEEGSRTKSNGVNKFNSNTTVSQEPGAQNELNPTDSPETMLTKITSGNPALQRYMEMQESNGVTSEAMMGQIKQMQSNPMMLSVMSKFKDPAFQKTFLENLKKMKKALNPNGEEGPEDENIAVLRGLFQQLNAQGQH